MSPKEKIEFIRERLRSAKEIVLELLSEDMNEKQKKMILELYRILK